MKKQTEKKRKNFVLYNERNEKFFRIFRGISVACYGAAVLMMVMDALDVPPCQTKDLFSFIGLGLLLCGGIVFGIAGLFERDIPGIMEIGASSQEEFESLIRCAKNLESKKKRTWRQRKHYDSE